MKFNLKSLGQFILAAAILIIAFNFGNIFKNRNSNQLSHIPVDIGGGLGEQTVEADPFSIVGIKNKEYHGSDLVVEQDMGNKGKFHSFIVSYISDGNKLRSIMNVPNSPKPENGYPVLILAHGFIPPDTYSTISSYKAFTDYYSNNGFLVFKPDYRGHDDSEGIAVSAHLSPDYVTDVLNLISSVKNRTDADKNNMAIWGHSMGGGIALKVITVDPSIKAALLVAGVVASPQKFFEYWDQNKDAKNIPAWIKTTGVSITVSHGTPVTNPEYWSGISPYTYLDDIKANVSIHHGTADASVPIIFSEEINTALKEKNKSVEYFVYAGADHNLAGSARSLFLSRSLEFLNNNLK